MKNMLSPPYLVIGAGNMGIPVIASLLKNGVDAKDITIITGALAGKTNNEATAKALLKEGVSQQQLDMLQMISRDNQQTENYPPPKTIIYATKPQYFELVANDFACKELSADTIISIAAGLDCVTLQRLSEQADVIRTMPNLIRSMYGVFAETSIAEEKITTLYQLMKSMGKPLRVPNENEAFDNLLVHSGCGPAFVAAYVAAQTEKGMDASSVFAALRGSIKGYPTLATSFYKNWQNMLLLDFGHEQAKEILDATILGTIEILEQTNENPLEFANRVRSGRGITNAGLLCMGVIAPNEERFGNAEERQIQNQIAQDFRSCFTAEDSIIPALLAAKARAIGIKTDNHNPLYLAGEFQEFAQIKNAAQTMFAPHFSE